jgi:hypothetical protein
MAEKQNGPCQPSFSVSLKVDFQGLRATSDGDLIPVCELGARPSPKAAAGERVLAHCNSERTSLGSHDILSG